MIRKALRASLLKTLHRFRRHQAGSAAVEFAIILPVFLLMLVAMVQIPLVFVAGQHLESATTGVGRLIQTGQVQSQGMTPAQFRSALCNQMGVFLKCSGTNLRVEVRRLSGFASVPRGIPLDEEGKFEDEVVYQPGNAGEVVVVRVFYQFPVWLSAFLPTLANLPNGNRLLMSSVVFQNEPFYQSQAAGS
ncbi:TadE/TadG family type IV pilus assembly protein [Microvirga sp. 2YAF29]|uniref:TadE/TadG family type IV pilus assembly protein n=1 Tax=Microvirga sp. 2YAF29 TaxID=3233031 RepID=UPI003F97AE43